MYSVCFLQTKLRLGYFNRKYILLLLPLHSSPSGPWSPHYRGFTTTLRHTTLGGSPLDEWSAGIGDLYLTTHNTYKRHTCPRARFEPTISAGERQQSALDRAATGIGKTKFHDPILVHIPVLFHDRRVCIINYRMLKVEEWGSPLFTDYYRDTDGYKNTIQTHLPFSTGKADEECWSHCGIQTGIHTSPTPHYFLLRGINIV